MHLLVGSRDYVRSWNFATRAFEFAVPEELAMAATPTVGDLFVVANNQKIDPNEDAPSAHRQCALIYSYSRRRLVAELPGYGARAAISPDGQLIAAAGRTNGTVLWRPATGEMTPLSHHPREYDPRHGILLSFSPDGRMLLVSGDERRPPALWDVAARRIKAYLGDGHIQLGAVAWSPDSQFLAGGGENQNIGVWAVPPDIAADAPEGPPYLRPLTILHGHENVVSALAYSPDGRWLASAANDHSIRFWASPDAPVLVPKARPDTMLEYTLDSKSGCIVARADGKLTVWAPQQGYVPRSLPGTQRHFHAGFLARSQGFVAVEITTNGAPAYVEIRGLPDGDVQTRREILRAPQEFQSRIDPRIQCLGASPNGQWLAVPLSSVDGAKSVQIFAMDTGRFVTRLPKPRGILWNLRMSPDSRWLVLLAHSDGGNRIAIYDTRTWQLAQEVFFHSADIDVTAAAIDPSSRFLASGGLGKNSLRVWDLHTGRLVGHCDGNVHHYHPVWSRDSRTLIVRDTGGLRFWSMVVFRELATLPVEWCNTHLPLGFTADGRALVIHAIGGRVQSWSPPTLAEIDGAP